MYTFRQCTLEYSVLLNVHGSVLTVLYAVGSFPDILQEAQVPLMSSEVCAKVLSKEDLEPYKVLSSNLCAGYPEGEIDTCDVSSVLGTHYSIFETCFWALNSYLAFAHICALGNHFFVQNTFKL